MKIIFDKNGTIDIYAENDLESFALTQFNKKWKDENHAGIIIHGDNEGIGDE